MDIVADNNEIIDHEKAKGLLRLKKFVASKLGYSECWYISFILIGRH